MVEWSEAPSTVLDLAKRIIERDFGHLSGARIAFIFRSEAPESNGKVTYGKCKKISSQLQLHIPYEFVIWLARDKYITLSAHQREALIFHELCHCEWDGQIARIKGHDVEEFNRVIRKFGFWWPESDEFEIAVHAAALQPMLIADEPKREGSVGTIDFGKIAKEVAEGMREHDFGDGVETEFRVAGSKDE